MKILAPDEAGLGEAVALLARGLPIGMPTETVYGLAADATDDAAVARVFEAKDRPRFDPLIVHVAPGDPLEALAPWAVAPPELSALLAVAWPGPLTVVLPRREGVSDLVTSGLCSVAVRMPAHPVARRLLERFGAVVAPSANRFGRISPTTAADVVAELDGRVTAVLDGGRCEVGLESTVVSLLPGEPPRLLRPGGMPVELVEAWLGPLSPPTRQLRSPGQLPSHYAPATPLTSVPPASGTVAALTVVGPTGPLVDCLEALGLHVLFAASLSPVRDPVEAARALFGTLRHLDELGADTIVVEPCPGPGLLHAIDDRLRRAGYGSPKT